MKKAWLAVGVFIIAAFVFSSVSAEIIDSKTFIEIAKEPTPYQGQLEIVLTPKKNLEPKQLSKQGAEEEIEESYKYGNDEGNTLDNSSWLTQKSKEENSSLKAIREKLKSLQEQSRQNKKKTTKRTPTAEPKRPSKGKELEPEREIHPIGRGILIDKKGWFLSPLYRDTISFHLSGVRGKYNTRKYNISFQVVFNGRAYPAEFVSIQKELILWRIKKNLENTQLKPPALSKNIQTQLGQIVAIVGKDKRKGQFIKIGHISSKSKNFIRVSSYGGQYDTYGAIVFNLQKEIIGIVEEGNYKVRVIPLNQSVITELIKSSKKEIGRQKSWIGVELLELNKKAAEYLKETVGLNLRQEKGVVVRDYPLKGSPANYAGLKKGDIIKSINGQEINNLEEARKLIEGAPPGKMLTIEIIEERTGRTRTIQIEPIKMDIYHEFLESQHPFFPGKIY